MSNQIGIYRVNLGGDGWFYVGKSINLAKRKIDHLCYLRAGTHRNPHMQSVYGKYQVFEFVILEFCSETELTIKEQALLDAHFADPKNVNIAFISESTMKGRKLSEASRKKISITHQGKTTSDITRKRMSDAQTGRWHSIASRQKMSNSKMGHSVSDAHRKLTSESLSGRTLSDAHRKNLSIAARTKKTNKKFKAEEPIEVSSANIS